MSPINKRAQSGTRLISWTQLISLEERMRPQIVLKKCKRLGAASNCPDERRQYLSSSAFNERAAIWEGSERGMEPNHRITRDTSRYKPTLGCLWPITNTMQYKCAVCDQSEQSWTIARPGKIVWDSRTDFSWNYWGTLVMANLNPLSNVHKVSVTNQRSPFGMQQL